MFLGDLNKFDRILSKYLLVLTSILIYVILKDLALFELDVPLDLLLP